VIYVFSINSHFPFVIFSSYKTMNLGFLHSVESSFGNSLLVFGFLYPLFLPEYNLVLFIYLLFSFLLLLFIIYFSFGPYADYCHA
jgi:hypothetical protein